MESVRSVTHKEIEKITSILRQNGALPEYYDLVLVDTRMLFRDIIEEPTATVTSKDTGGATVKSRKNGKMIAFGWYGGKYSHLDWLLPLLPECHHYCEPFGGSGAVLINRKPSPVETFNDIDGEVVNFFRVLRDQKNALLEAIGLSPFSREEFERAIQRTSDDHSDLEKARLFFIRARQVRTGLAQTASNGRWAHCRLTTRAGMAGAVSRWLGSVEGLPEVAQRLIRVQIENAPAKEVIKRYDSEETLFYCDPPYPHSSRGDSNAYSYEMTDAQHRELAEVLHSVKGKVAISGYHCSLMDELYGDFTCNEARTRNCLSVKSPRQEVLWTNYKPSAPPAKTGGTKEWNNKSHQKSLL